MRELRTSGSERGWGGQLPWSTRLVASQWRTKLKRSKARTHRLIFRSRSPLVDGCGALVDLRPAGAERHHGRLRPANVCPFPERSIMRGIDIYIVFVGLVATIILIVELHALRAAIERERRERIAENERRTSFRIGRSSRWFRRREEGLDVWQILASLQ